MADPGVAWLSLFMATHMLIYAATGSMWVVALTDRGLGAMAFVWMGSVAALGQLASLTWWGKLVDLHGPRSTLSYLSWGILDGGQNMGRTRSMMDAVTENNQVAGFNAIMCSGSLGGIIGGLAGGWTFGRIGDSEMTIRGFPI